MNPYNLFQGVEFKDKKKLKVLQELVYYDTSTIALVLDKKIMYLPLIKIGGLNLKSL